MATDTEAINRLVTAAPTLALPQEAMEQIVGWSSNEQRPVTLREFVAARAPAVVRAALAVDPVEVPSERVKRVTELGEDEVRQMVLSILRSDSGRAVLAVVGEGSYSADQLIADVESGTPIGRRLIAATTRLIDLLEGLIEAGKVAGVSQEPPRAAPPEFDF